MATATATSTSMPTKARHGKHKVAVTVRVSGTIRVIKDKTLRSGETQRTTTSWEPLEYTVRGTGATDLYATRVAWAIARTMVLMLAYQATRPFQAATKQAPVWFDVDLEMKVDNKAVPTAKTESTKTAYDKVHRLATLSDPRSLDRLFNIAACFR